ncbi:alpha/beta hydrolase [Litoricolaceae bacterium]|jgi:pimeloyl-ACP methyl ester carboxylesterase|nr:alpha/beta hydrolase [Litorivicinaceae bacterium]
MTKIVLIPGLLSDARVFSGIKTALPQFEWFDFERSASGSLARWGQEVLSVTGGPVVLFGHSMGARIALESWAFDSSRVAGLILADFGVDGTVTEKERSGRADRVRGAYEKGMSNLLDSWLKPMVAKGFDINDRYKQLEEMVLKETPESHEQQIDALLNRPNAEAYLNAIRCPTLLLVGDQDQWSPAEQHIKIGEKLVGSQVEVVQGAGHFLPFERPDVVASLVHDWIEEI